MTADLRLAIPAGFGWMAAIAVIGVPGAELVAALGAWALAGLLTAAALLRRTRWLPLVALAVAAAALCCTSVALQAGARQPPELREAAAEHRVLTVEVVTTQVVQPGSGRFEGELMSERGTVPVLVFAEAGEQRLGIGTVVGLRGTLAEASPGDDRAFLFFAEGAAIAIAPPAPLIDWANDLRERFLQTTEQLPGEGGDLLTGLSIGDTTAVGDELDSAMKTSSLSHLTAVSGANCAIIIGLVIAVGRAVGMPRALRFVLALAVLLAFVVLVTPEPSVLRAAVMAGIVLFALLGGRPVRGIPVLSLAVLALLVSDPWLARSAGFALSVLATAGLLLLAGPLAAQLERWLPSWLALVIAVPLAAQLSCQPVLILLDASLSTYGVAANVLAAPAAPLATVVGLAACLASALAPGLGMALAWVAWVPSAWIAAVAGFFAAAPSARLPWPGGILGAALLALATALVIAAALGRRRWALVAVAVLVVGYAGLTGGARIAQLVSRPTDWQVAGCDVGQGDAYLVRSAGQVALIDTGPEPAALATCLAELGIARIDLLVLSHFDLDHVGGTSAVTGRVGAVIVGPTAGTADERVLENLAESGARVVAVKRGDTGVLGELRWNVLWPPTRLGGIAPGNDASVTLAFAAAAAGCECLNSLFLGDLGEGIQERLLTGGSLRADIVKVSHHGSADQSARLYERVGAAAGLIGVGEGNGYGHPTDRLLGILVASGTTALRSDERGLVLVSPGSQPGSLRVWTER